MKSIVYDRVGDPSVLRLVERKIPEPGSGEVRVRVVVSGLNPSDWKARWGRAGRMAFPEITPHIDGAGFIDAIGPGVAGRAVGERVWVYLAAIEQPTGTAQEYTVLPAGRVVPLPDGVSFDAGACVGAPAMTAHWALTVAENGPRRLAPGALDDVTVLVAGGAGAVGNAAIQLARWSGATVIATVSSPEKAALATAAGAHHVVNYREGDPAAKIRAYASRGVDVIVELAFAPNAALDSAILAPNGTIAIYGDDGGNTARIDLRACLARNARLQFLVLYSAGQDVLHAAASDINAALVANALRFGEGHGLPLIRYPLARTADAHAAVEAGVTGKVLVDVTPA